MTDANRILNVESLRFAQDDSGVAGCEFYRQKFSGFLGVNLSGLADLDG